MNLFAETFKKVSELFKSNPQLEKALLSLDRDAIRSLTTEFQNGINPKDVVDAFEFGEESLEYLRKKAERQIAVKELYKALCTIRAIKDQE